MRLSALFSLAVLGLAGLLTQGAAAAADAKDCEGTFHCGGSIWSLGLCVCAWGIAAA
jgi:hypothetical protein